MTCENIQILLDDYVDGTLSTVQEEVVDRHCEACDNCSQRLKSLRLQKQVLSSLPVPPPSENFSQNVIANAIESAGTGQNATGRYYKFAAAAMISALVLWLGVFEGQRSNNEDLYLVSVDDEVRTIKVAIESEQALESVSMHIELSDNLELSGFGSKKQINWTTGLSEGTNVISLPIIGIAQGKGDITTRVRLNGKEKVMHIKTLYKSPGNVYYESRTVLNG